MKSLFILFFTFLSFFNVYSQNTKDSLVELIIQKNGGRRNLESLKSLHIKSYSISSLSSQDTALNHYYVNKDNKFIHIGEYKTYISKLGYNGKESWYRKYDKKTLDTMPSFIRRNIHKADFGKKKSFIGIFNMLILMDAYSLKENISIEYDKKIKEEKCLIIRIITKDSEEYDFFIHPESHRIIAISYTKDKYESFTSYEDYRKVQNIYYPFKSYTELAKSTSYEIIKEIQINPTISESVFEPPQK